ncbi:MAG: cytochrome c biogenesis protein CcdA [Pseudomonadota bacterium]
MFGVDIFDAALMPALFVALAAGMLSFLSPCVLPIVPPYLAYMAGTTLEEGRSRVGDRRVVAAALFFVLGLSTVFVFFGLAASSLGRMMLMYQREMAIASGLVIILFGLHFLNVLRIPLLYREARLDAGHRGGSVFGAYVLGLAFAFGWTPCIGPVLGMIIALAAQEEQASRGMAMMGVYALGLGLPFLLAAIFLNRFMSVMSGVKRHMGRIERVMGALLVLVGVMLVTGLFTALSFWLLEAFPALAAIG